MHARHADADPSHPGRLPDRHGDCDGKREMRVSRDAPAGITPPPPPDPKVRTGKRPAPPSKGRTREPKNTPPGATAQPDYFTTRCEVRGRRSRTATDSKPCPHSGPRCVQGTEPPEIRAKPAGMAMFSSISPPRADPRRMRAFR